MSIELIKLDQDDLMALTPEEIRKIRDNKKVKIKRASIVRNPDTDELFARIICKVVTINDLLISKKDADEAIKNLRGNIH